MSGLGLMVHTSSFLLASDKTQPKRCALVILNKRLPRFTPQLWENAKIRLCPDGGANRLYDELPLFFPDEEASVIRNRYIPDVINGGMDSIRPDVLDFYVRLGTRVIDESHDQNTTLPQILINAFRISSVTLV